MQRSSATEFYKAAVEASANEVPLAVEHLRSVIAAAPHSSDADRAHDLLANLFFRNGRYQDGLKEIEAALKEHPDAEDAKKIYDADFRQRMAQSIVNGILAYKEAVEAKPAEIKPGEFKPAGAAVKLSERQ